jgi:allantoin racemase
MVINPTTAAVPDAETEQEFASYASPGTQIGVTRIDYGPASIECELDKAICVPDFLRKAQQAEAEGYDAVITDCFCDPGMRPARELLNIPVVGPAESSMHFAASLGQRFSVVTVLPNILPTLERLAEDYGVEKKLASVRYVNIPVLKLRDKGKLIKGLHQEMRAAIREDGAHVLIIGCTGMMGVAKELQRRLKQDGYDVPVVDPVGASLKFAEALVSMGLKQSRLTAMPPPKKDRTGFPAAGVGKANAT